MHTIVRLEPLPHRNSLFAAFVAAQYMDQSGEGIHPPYGALSTPSARSATPASASPPSPTSCAPGRSEDACPPDPPPRPGTDRKQATECGSR